MPFDRKNTFSNISFVFDTRLSRFVYIEDAFAILLQIEANELTPAMLLSKVHPDDADYVKDKSLEFLEGSLFDCVEFRILSGADLYWLRATPFLISSEGANLIAVKVADITAWWKNSENIRKYANKKNSVLNMLAHDLRGPLDIAHTLTKSIAKKLAEPELLKLTSSISGILDQSVQLIVNLIDRELLDTVDVELSMNRVDIVSKVYEYIEECKRSLSADGRLFRFSSSDESIYLTLDEAKFMQIMNNLVSNSLKFTHPGALISIDILEKDNSVLFTLSDSGIGIPENLQEALFDKFTKARRKGLNGEPATGLGLSIVKMIVDWHNGTIWFKSKENEGTTFYVEIPKVNE